MDRSRVWRAANIDIVAAGLRRFADNQQGDARILGNAVCEGPGSVAYRSRSYAVLRFSNTVVEKIFSIRRSGTRIENRHGAHYRAGLNVQ